MIKNNKGITLSALVVTVIVIILLAGITITTSDLVVKKTRSKNMYSNMYLIKGKVETIYEDYTFDNDESVLVGKEHIDADSLEATPYGNGITRGEEDNFWYTWDKDTLKALGFDPHMISSDSDDVFFIVNYATGEVIYSKGFDDGTGEIKYKLSDLKPEE